MSLGAAVWAAVGGAWVVWLGVTTASRSLPGIAAVVRSVLSSWAGRAITLAAWGGAGWHLFCQRP